MAPDYTKAREPRPPRRFTVLLPVVRPPDMLACAIRSVLAQTETDLELCVVCDGAPPETAAVAQGFADADPRVFVFSFPKGARLGEAHRAAVLDGARTEFVAQIGDDDLWFAHHLVALGRLMENADFVTVPGFKVHPDRHLRLGPFGDLRWKVTRRKLTEGRWNFFGPTEAGYRLDAYRRLPAGWAPGPENLQSDLNMWRKFVAYPGMRFNSAAEISTLKLPTPRWQDCTAAARKEANMALWNRLRDPATLSAIRSDARLRLARSIKLQHYPRLVLLDPHRYLPLFALKQSGAVPDDRPLF